MRKIIIKEVHTFTRLVTLPTKVIDEHLNILKNIKGIEKCNIAGYYDMYYEIDISYDCNLIDDNVKFAFEQINKI